MFIELALAAMDEVQSDCTWNGIPLYGEVQIVESFADIEVQVEKFP